ncbi:MAG: SRPBCC domain-containing protein, partial [Dehalococcoidia bacterium]|nr:SRPBCC domain-containing protein [Dehalococcoidia bacterium]
MPEGKVEFVVEAPLDASWELFLNAARWALCMPGCKGVTRVSESEWDGVFEVRVLHTSRTVLGRLQAVDITPSTNIRYQGRGELREGFHRYGLTLGAEMHLEALPDGKTRVRFAGEIAAKGLGGAIINKIVSAKMDEMTRGFEYNVRQLLEGGHSRVGDTP